MNQKMKWIRFFVFVLNTVIAIGPIVFPLPLVIIQGLLVFDYVFALFLFFVKWSNWIFKWASYSKLIMDFCLFMCVSMIATIRFFLSAEKLEDHFYLARLIGGWICMDNIVCGFFSILILCGAIIFFCTLVCPFIMEYDWKESFNPLNQKFFDIDQEVLLNKITEEEAKLKKKEVQDKADHYRTFCDAVNYFMGTIVVFLIMYLIMVAGGFAFGMIELNMTWRDALNQYVMLSAGYFILFMVPFLIIGVNFIKKAERW